VSEKQYEGSAWTDDEEAAVAGAIVFEDHVVRFTGDTTVVDLPFDDLELEVRGATVELVNPERSDWSIGVDGLAVLNDRALRSRTGIRRQIEDYEDRRDGFKRLAVTFVFFGGFIGLSALLGLMVEAAMPKMVAMVPTSYEKKVAMEVAEEVGDFFDEYEETNVVAQLHAMLDRILPPDQRGDYEFELSLIDSPVPNAMTLPGGRMYVFTGLLSQADSAEEVAGVLAHEVAHVMRRHAMRAMIANAGPSAVFDHVLGSSKGFLGALAASSEVLIRQNFSRDHESDADDKAFDYLVAAGIDPRGLDHFLSKLSKMEGDLGAFRAVLSHPPSPERVAHLRKRWQDLRVKPDFTPLKELDWDPPERPNMIEQLLGF